MPALVAEVRSARSETLRLLAVGDVGFSGRVAVATKGMQDDPGLFGAVRPVLAESALLFGNLEGPLFDGRVGDLFCGPQRAGRVLSDAGFGILNVANNHVLDYGPEGLSTTLSALRSSGIQPLGGSERRALSSSLVRSDVGQVRIGWLGAAHTQYRQRGDGPGVWELDEGRLRAAVAVAREDVDVLILSLHAGFMFVEYPHPALHKLAHRCVDAGADVVLMHHPHVLQGIEVLEQGKAICYSMGNFLFDWQEGCVRATVVDDLQQEGGIFGFDLDCDGLVRFSFLPTVIGDRMTVEWPSDERALKIVERVRMLSQSLSGDFASAFWRQRSERNVSHGLRMLARLAITGQVRELSRQLGRLRPSHGRMLVEWLLRS